MNIYELTPRQWAQCKAALKFWRAVAEQSRQHPSRHPGVADYFAEYAPLSLDEIDELLDNDPNNSYVTGRQVAGLLGSAEATIRKRIKQANLKPDIILNRVEGFRPERIWPLVEDLAK